MERVQLSSPDIHGELTANWWDEINESVKWQDGIFFTLCGAYALVSAVALVSTQITISSTIQYIAYVVLCVCGCKFII